MLKLYFTSRAKEDIEDILLYTILEWGERQGEVYEQLLRDTMNTLLHNPGAGFRHADLPAKYRCFTAGKHLIVYHRRANDLIIARILHQHMAISKRLLS